MRVFCFSLLGLLSVGLLFGGACSTTTSCKGELSSFTLNPQGSSCTQRCECNNQNYEGYCVGGSCVALQRESCEVAERVQACELARPFADVAQAQPSCPRRIRICKDEAGGLTTRNWGDCRCISSYEKLPEGISELFPAEAASEPSLDMADAGGADEMGDAGPEDTANPPELEPSEGAPDASEADLPEKEPAPETTLESNAEGSPEPVVPEREPASETLSEAPDGEPIPEVDPPELAPAGTQALYGDCKWYVWAPLTQRCQTGLFCYRVDENKAVCLKDCSRDPGRCARESSGVCRVVDWSEKGKAFQACVQEAQKGASCDPSRGRFCKASGSAPSVCQKGSCVAASYGGAGLPCDASKMPVQVCDIAQQVSCNTQGQCEKGRRKFRWDDCTQDGLCPKGLTCLVATIGQTAKYCLQTCSSASACTGSSASYVCDQGICLQSACKRDGDCDHPQARQLCLQSKCLPNPKPGPIAFGEICDASNASTSCLGNFRCYTTGGAKGYCSAECASDADCLGYKAGYGCFGASGSGFCAKICQSGADCPQGMGCLAGQQRPWRCFVTP